MRTGAWGDKSGSPPPPPPIPPLSAACGPAGQLGNVHRGGQPAVAVRNGSAPRQWPGSGSVAGRRSAPPRRPHGRGRRWGCRASRRGGARPPGLRPPPSSPPASPSVAAARRAPSPAPPCGPAATTRSGTRMAVKMVCRSVRPVFSSSFLKISDYVLPESYEGLHCRNYLWATHAHVLIQPFSAVCV